MCRKYIVHQSLPQICIYLARCRTSYSRRIISCSHG